MTRKDHRILFTALGFLAVIMRDDLPLNKQGARAASLAKLIESFCVTTLPDAFGDEHLPYSLSPQDIERLVEEYVTALRDEGFAPLSHDRKTLLAMYELLIIQKLRHEQAELYMLGSNDMIANRVLQLAHEIIGQGKP